MLADCSKLVIDMRKLRPITIHVVEPQPRRFKWVLSEIEEPSQTLRELHRSPSARPTYQKAMADGLAKLQSLIPDLDTGPVTAPSAGAQPKSPGAALTPVKDASDSTSTGVPKSRPFFGFGPAR